MAQGSSTCCYAAAVSEDASTSPQVQSSPRKLSSAPTPWAPCRGTRVAMPSPRRILIGRGVARLPAPSWPSQAHKALEAS